MEPNFLKKLYKSVAVTVGANPPTKILCPCFDLLLPPAVFGRAAADGGDDDDPSVPPRAEAVGGRDSGY